MKIIELRQILFPLIFCFNVLSLFGSASPEGYMKEFTQPSGPIKKEIFEIENPNENDPLYTGIGINRYSEEGYHLETEYVLKEGFQKIYYIYADSRLQEIRHITTKENKITAPYYIQFRYENDLLVSIERFYYDDSKIDNYWEFFLKDYTEFNVPRCHKIEFEYDNMERIERVFYFSSSNNSKEIVISKSEYIYKDERLNTILFFSGNDEIKNQRIINDFLIRGDKIAQDYLIDNDYKIVEFFYESSIEIDINDYLEIDFSKYETANIKTNIIYLYQDEQLFRKYEFRKGRHWSEDPTFCLLQEYDEKGNNILSQYNHVTGSLLSTIDTLTQEVIFSEFDEFGNWKEVKYIYDTDSSMDLTIHRTLEYY